MSPFSPSLFISIFSLLITTIPLTAGEGNLATAAKKVKTIIGHRGSALTRPENTMASFRRAIEVGATVAEVDVRTTKDKILVISHDADLFRITKKKTLINDLTLSELQKIDAGIWFHSKYAGEKIPTLRDVLELCKDKIDVLLDIKEEGDDYLDSILSEVKRQGQPKRLHFGVRSSAQAKWFRKKIRLSLNLVEKLGNSVYLHRSF